MRRLLVMIGLILAASGCNKAKPPDQVAQDVATAQAKAAVKVAEVRQDVAKNSADAAQEAAENAKDLNNTNAQGAHDLAVTKADGEHTVAIEKCMALAGDAQKACKDQADANFDLAKAKAKAALAAQKQ